jgi:predicted DNA-binding transcriptional regulator AlpA
MDELLRIHQVAAIVGASESSIYCFMRPELVKHVNGKRVLVSNPSPFPMPIQALGRTVAWRRSDVQVWIDSRQYVRRAGAVKNPWGRNGAPQSVRAERAA